MAAFFFFGFFFFFFFLLSPCKGCQLAVRGALRGTPLTACSCIGRAIFLAVVNVVFSIENILGYLLLLLLSSILVAQPDAHARR